MSQDAVFIPRHGQLGPTACKLVEALKDGKPGDVLTDEELEKVCGLKTTVRSGKGYTALGTALRYTLRTFGVHWKRVPGEGCIKVLTPTETVEDMGADIKSLQKKSRRAGQKGAIVDTSKLDDDAKRKLHTQAAIVGTLELVTNPALARKLEAKSVSSVPNVGKVLELFD